MTRERAVLYGRIALSAAWLAYVVVYWRGAPLVTLAVAAICGALNLALAFWSRSPA